MSEKTRNLRLRSGSGPSKYTWMPHRFLRVGPNGKPTIHEVSEDLAVELLGTNFFEITLDAPTYRQKPAPVKLPPVDEDEPSDVDEDEEPETDPAPIDDPLDDEDEDEDLTETKTETGADSEPAPEEEEDEDLMTRPNTATIPAKLAPLMPVTRNKLESLKKGALIGIAKDLGIEDRTGTKSVLIRSILAAL